MDKRVGDGDDVQQSSNAMNSEFNNASIDDDQTLNARDDAHISGCPFCYLVVHLFNDYYY